jgi:hypothetical protein
MRKSSGERDYIYLSLYHGHEISTGVGSGRSGEPADGPALAGSDGSSMQVWP